MTTYTVTCRSQAVTGTVVQVNVKAPDPDVAIYRAKRLGFDAVTARPV